METDLTRHLKKLWMEQCACAVGLRSFTVEKALDYLIAQKLLTFMSAAERKEEYAAELPHFLAEIRRLFTAAELTGYLDQLQRKKYRRRRQLKTDSRDASLDTLMDIAESQRFYRMRELLER